MSSEVHVESKAANFLLSRCARHNSCLLVFADALLKKVGFALQRDQFHPIEWVGHVEQFGMPESCQKAVGHKLDVFCHQVAVHTDEVARKCLADEFTFHFHSTANDVVNYILWELMLQHAIEHASKLGVQAFIS